MNVKLVKTDLDTIKRLAEEQKEENLESRAYTKGWLTMSDNALKSLVSDITNHVWLQICGKAINPLSVEGQIQGAAALGIGLGLFEEIVHNEKGRTINPSFKDYKVPTALDLPTILPIIVEEPEPKGPYGAKGVGEGAIIPAAPPIANALYEAIGVRIKELPLTPEKIYNALKAS